MHEIKESDVNKYIHNESFYLIAQRIIIIKF